jgi:hypothetical protein
VTSWLRDCVCSDAADIVSAPTRIRNLRTKGHFSFSFSWFRVFVVAFKNP